MLDSERQFFAEHQADLLQKYPGKFVVIKEQQVCGSFETIQEALAAGARQFGLVDFLVRRTDQTPTELSIPALALGILSADPSHSTSGPGQGS